MPMNRVIEIVVGSVAIVILFFLAWLHPGPVDFHYWTGRSIRLPLGWLLVFTFLAGVIIVAAVSSLLRLGRRLGSWRARRRVRQAVRVEHWHHSGTTLHWDGDLQGSRGLLRRAWRSQTKNSAAALALAASYLDTGEYRGAQEVLTTAVEEDPNDPDLRYAFAEVLRRNGEQTEAIRMLETVRVQHPRAARALLGLRDLYCEGGSWREAAQLQETYLKILSDGERPSERERWLHLRYQAAVSLEDLTPRVDALSALVQSERNFVPAVISLGDGLIMCQRPEEAKRLWERAFRNHPRLVFIERLLAQQNAPRDRQKILTLMNKYSEQLDANRCHLLNARAALASDQLDAAAKELQTIAQQDSRAVRKCWAELYHRRGQVEEAWKTIHAIIETGGHVGSIYRCTTCRRFSRVWTGYCRICKQWDSYRFGGDLH